MFGSSGRLGATASADCSIKVSGIRKRCGVWYVVVGMGVCLVCRCGGVSVWT